MNISSFAVLEILWKSAHFLCQKSTENHLKVIENKLLFCGKKSIENHLALCVINMFFKASKILRKVYFVDKNCCTRQHNSRTQLLEKITQFLRKKSMMINFFLWVKIYWRIFWKSASLLGYTKPMKINSFPWVNIY